MKLANIIFLFFLLFLTKLYSSEILELRKQYLKGELIKPPTYFQENFTETEEILYNLTLFEHNLDKNNLEEAQKYALSLQDYYPISQLVNFKLGEHYFLNKNYIAAKEYFEKCIKNDSQFHEARRYLAKICFELKEYENAYKHYNVLSWFRPDKDVLEKIEYLTNHISYWQETTETLKFAEISVSTSIVSPKIDVGISTKDNGKLMQIDCVKFYSKDDFVIYNEDGKKFLECKGGLNNQWTIVYRTRLKKIGVIAPPLNKEIRTSSKFIIVEPKFSTNTFIITEYKWFKNSFPQLREYRGKLIIKRLKDQIIVINKLPIEEYLYSVVAREIGKDRPDEALKTQAIIARTLAVYRTKTSSHKYFDVCRGQHCQAYEGVRCEAENVTKAVNDTTGEVIFNNGKVANIFFHANCGGLFSISFFNKHDLIADFEINIDTQTTFALNNQEKLFSWYLLPPKLYCGPSQLVHPGCSRWLRVVKRTELSKYLNEKYKIGNLKEIKIIERKDNGYITKLKLIGTKKKVVLNCEHLIRNITPLGNLRSASFYLEYNKTNSTYYFWGAGWGHGVGMCQSGVSNLAKEGKKNYIDIIKHYYPNTEIKKIYFLPYP